MNRFSGVWRWLAGDKESCHAWGDVEVPGSKANLHFLAAGATGGGKTTLLRMLLRSVFLDVLDEKKDVRVLLYDPKAQWNTELVDLGLEGRRKIFDPFDSRSVAWDMSADLTEDVDADSFAALLYPEDIGGENRFFYQAARKLLKGVVLAFITLYRNRGREGGWSLDRPWDFRDILLACANLEDLKTLLTRADLATDNQEDFLSVEREARSVRMTVAVENDTYNAIAAGWHNSREKVSVASWPTERSVWLLGASKRYRSALSAINKLMIQRLQQLILDDYKGKKTPPTRRHWIVLDEFPSLGMIPYFEELLTEGRERGVCVVLGLQHISHVRKLYRELTEALLGGCKHQAFFAANDAEMAEWCSKRFPHLIEYDEDSPHIKRRSPSVVSDEFFWMPSADATRGFTCILKTDPSICEYPRSVNVTPDMGPPPLDEVEDGDMKRAGFVPRSGAELRLEPWSKEERKKLGLPPKPPKAAGLPFPKPLVGWEVFEDADRNG